METRHAKRNREKAERDTNARLALRLVQQVAPTKSVRVEIRGSALRSQSHGTSRDTSLQMEAIVQLGAGPVLRPRNPDNLRLVQHRLNETGTGMTVKSLVKLVQHCRTYFSPAGWTAAHPNPLTGGSNLLRFTSISSETPLTPDERHQKMLAFRQEWSTFVRSQGWTISELPIPRTTTDDAQLYAIYVMTP